MPEGQVNAHAVGYAQWQVTVLRLCVCGYMEVTERRLARCMQHVEYVQPVSLYGWDSVGPAFDHSGSSCELHVESVLVTGAPMTTSLCLTVEPHIAIKSFLCV